MPFRLRFLKTVRKNYDAEHAAPQTRPYLTFGSFQGDIHLFWSFRDAIPGRLPVNRVPPQVRYLPVSGIFRENTGVLRHSKKINRTKGWSLKNTAGMVLSAGARYFQLTGYVRIACPRPHGGEKGQGSETAC